MYIGVGLTTLVDDTAQEKAKTTDNTPLFLNNRVLSFYFDFHFHFLCGA